MIIDWQMCRYASPILDIVFLLFVNTNQSLRVKHFDDLTVHYLSTCQNFLEKLGGHAHFSKEEFNKQMKTFGLFGFILSVSLIPLLIRPMEVMADAEKFMAAIKNPEEHKELADKIFEIRKPYAERMIGSIEDAFQMGLL